MIEWPMKHGKDVVEIIHEQADHVQWVHEKKIITQMII